MPAAEFTLSSANLANDDDPLPSLGGDELNDACVVGPVRDQLCPGQFVRLVGLKQGHLNGSPGTITKFVEASGRLGVSLHGCDSEKQ